MSTPEQGKGRAPEWIAVQSHVVGSLENWGYCRDWNGERHQSRQAAINAGLKQFGSDDFNVGRVEKGKLVWWGLDG